MAAKKRAAKPKPAETPRKIAVRKLTQWLEQDPIVTWLAPHYMLVEAYPGSAFRDSEPQWWWLFFEPSGATWQHYPHGRIYPPFCSTGPDPDPRNVPFTLLPECLAALSILAGTHQVHLVDVVAALEIQREPDQGRAGCFLTLPEGYPEENGMLDYMWEYDYHPSFPTLRGWTMSVEKPPTLTYRGNQAGWDQLVARLKRWFPIENLVGATNGEVCKVGLEVLVSCSG